MSAAESSRSKQLVTSCLPRMSLHHGENRAAQFCWHTPPLKKHDHREPRLTSVFRPQSMSPCQNNRHLTQSNWQLSDSLCALFQRNVSETHHLRSHWLKIRHLCLQTGWLVLYSTKVLEILLIDKCVYIKTMLIHKYVFILKAEKVIYNLSWKGKQFIYVGYELFNSRTFLKSSSEHKGKKDKFHVSFGKIEISNL